MSKGNLGNFIKEERVKKYKVASDFAKELHITGAYLSDIEKGNRLPAKELMIEIANKVCDDELKREKLYDLLASESRKFQIPIDIQQYLLDNNIICDVLRIAKKKKVNQNLWKKIKKKLEEGEVI